MCDVSWQAVKENYITRNIYKSDGCENKKEGLLHDFNTVPSKTKAEK